MYKYLQQFVCQFLSWNLLHNLFQTSKHQITCMKIKEYAEGQDSKSTCNILFVDLYVILQLKKTQKWQLMHFQGFEQKAIYK